MKEAKAEVPRGRGTVPYCNATVAWSFSQTMPSKKPRVTDCHVLEPYIPSHIEDFLFCGAASSALALFAVFLRASKNGEASPAFQCTGTNMFYPHSCCRILDIAGDHHCRLLPFIAVIYIVYRPRTYRPQHETILSRLL